MNDQMIISAIKEDDSTALMKYYRLLMPSAMKLRYKYDLDEESMKDAYQEAFVDLVLMIQEERIEHIEKRITDYFFGIVRIKVLGQLRVQKRHDNILSIVEEDLSASEMSEIKLPGEALTDIQEGLKENLLLLGDRCQELIRLFYYKEYSVNAIMNRMAYKSEAVVKSHKSRCMKKLKELMQNGKS